MSNCDGCGALSNQLSKHGFCVRCQKDKQATQRKRIKYQAIRSRRKAGVE